VQLELPSAAVSLLPRHQATPAAAGAEAQRVLAVASPRRLRLLLRLQTCNTGAMLLLKPGRLQLQKLL
jgi:hypothetical protein